MAEFSTNETMGHSADRLCAAFAISRQEQVCNSSLLSQFVDRGFTLVDCSQEFIMPHLTNVSGAYSVCPVRPSSCLAVCQSVCTDSCTMFCRSHFTLNYLTGECFACALLLRNILKLCRTSSVCPTIRLFGQNWSLNLGNFTALHSNCLTGEFFAIYYYVL